MVRIFASLAFAGALSLAAVPAFAQDLDIDLDPFHIFTPAPGHHHYHHHHSHHHRVMHHHHHHMHHRR